VRLTRRQLVELLHLFREGRKHLRTASLTGLKGERGRELQSVINPGDGLFSRNGGEKGGEKGIEPYFFSQGAPPPP